MSDRPPRVLFDATAVPADRGGVGRYVDELLPELDARGCTASGSRGARIQLMVVCRPEDRDHYDELCPHASIVTSPARTARRPVRLAWEQTGFPALVARARPDVVHSPHYTRPLATRRPVVVTLHDATFFSHPDVHLPVKRVFFSSWIKASLKTAAGIIVPSAATRDELVRLAGADASAIDVVHLGVDAKTFSVPTPSEVADARDLLGVGGRPYIGFLGTLEPRKNLPALVRAYVAAMADRADPPALVLAGGKGWDDGLDAALADVPGHLNVVRPGFLPIELLRGYLGGAALVAYPSLGEGFGLPVLEAMACGAAVLTTRRLALPEVGGDAVAYTEPDVDSMTTALRSLLDAGGSARRAELSQAGITRAAEFSWSAAAEKHLAIYERVANRVATS